MEHRHHVEAPQGSSDRGFGLVMAAVFALVGIWPAWSGDGLRHWALVAGAGFLACAIAAPGLLATPNRWWTALGALMNRIVSPIALGIVFALAVVPTGLLVRLTGKNPLRLGFDRSATTYWIARDPPGPAPESFTDQF